MKNLNINLDPVFNKLLANLKERTPLMKQISGIMLDNVHQNFESEGRPHWVSLADQTITDRRNKGYWPGKILQRTGQLLKSVTAKYDNDSAQVGTNKNYAALHQFGGTINQAARSSIYTQSRYLKGKRKGKFKKVSNEKRVFGKGFTFSARSINVPARPFLVLSDEGMSEIKQAIVNYIKK